MVRLLFICAVLVPLFRGCESNPPEPPLNPASVQGCYELALSHWEPHLDLGADQSFITPPQRVRLSTEPGPNGIEIRGYLLKPVPADKPSIHRWSFWKPEADRNVFLVWTTGFSGLTMTLHPEGTDLKGQAKTFWDFGRIEQRADVLARKIECQN